ncbi:MAG: hypothetical protein KA204_10015 [Chromatiaceae bacterium]|nr:hypothetical protein [Chromatiaceae bacterium]MBP6734697.1 hypothetical protein [Chromatiaceae bacterium]MBP6808939.1 hypothetical protein [Chromatiaceae bacterium]MBP8289919.1 hypothetical protein [Chromatiaceae bacterium]MBP9604097.1 hypothetical protein [Chromatiaceae bacterium]
MATARTLATALKADHGWLIGEANPGDVNPYRADPRAAIQSDYQAAPGRRELAGDEAVTACLPTTSDEGWCPRSIASSSSPLLLSASQGLTVPAAAHPGRNGRVKAA